MNPINESIEFQVAIHHSEDSTMRLRNLFCLAGPKAVKRYDMMIEAHNRAQECDESEGSDDSI